MLGLIYAHNQLSMHLRPSNPSYQFVLPKKSLNNLRIVLIWSNATPHNCFMALFTVYPGEPVPEEKLLDLNAQREINRGRHTDNPAGHHSIRTNQCPRPPYPQSTVSKHRLLTVDFEIEVRVLRQHPTRFC